MPKTQKKGFLNELGYTELSEKENELLNKHFSFENVDELAETKGEHNKLFNGIKNRAVIFKKMVKTVSNPVEKKELTM